jgi:hypothetical protein
MGSHRCRTPENFCVVLSSEEMVILTLTIEASVSSHDTMNLKSIHVEAKQSSSNVKGQLEYKMLVVNVRNRGEKECMADHTWVIPFIQFNTDFSSNFKNHSRRWNRPARFTLQTTALAF